MSSKWRFDEPPKIICTHFRNTLAPEMLNQKYLFCFGLFSIFCCFRLLNPCYTGIVNSQQFLFLLFVGYCSATSTLNSGASNLKHMCLIYKKKISNVGKLWKYGVHLASALKPPASFRLKVNLVASSAYSSRSQTHFRQMFMIST